MKYAGLIYDDSPHYLDHLAPFCALLDWPIIICEESIASLARRYYPDLKVILSDLWKFKLPSYIVSCEATPLLQAAFPNQNIRSLWLPHGNSDKGHSSFFFEALQEEKIALVYGQKMIDFMHSKDVFPQMIRIGNFRYRYFQKHEAFYRPFLPQTNNNILYAPTWDDSENNSSFWNFFPQLASAIPDDANLLVKLHPNTLKKHAAEIEILMGRYAKQNIHFLSQFPPIYPLLSRCSAYIGDMSSIGYDFLIFDRPMYFFNAKNLPLHQCGHPLFLEKIIFSNQKSFSSPRRSLYNYTFDPDPDCSQLKEQIDALCSL